MVLLALLASLEGARDDGEHDASHHDERHAIWLRGRDEVGSECVVRLTSANADEVLRDEDQSRAPDASQECSLDEPPDHEGLFSVCWAVGSYLENNQMTSTMSSGMPPMIAGVMSGLYMLRNNVDRPIFTLPHSPTGAVTHHMASS